MARLWRELKRKNNFTTRLLHFSTIFRVSPTILRANGSRDLPNVNSIVKLSESLLTANSAVVVEDVVAEETGEETAVDTGVVTITKTAQIKVSDISISKCVMKKL